MTLGLGYEGCAPAMAAGDGCADGSVDRPPSVSNEGGSGRPRCGRRGEECTLLAFDVRPEAALLGPCEALTEPGGRG